MKYTIVTGNIVDGMEGNGVFDTIPEAVAAADNFPRGTIWIVMPINPVKP